MKEMKDFDKQLKRYGDELCQTRCPYSDAELDRKIRNVVWRTEKTENNATRVSGSPFSVLRTPLPWIAAACLAAVLIPLGLAPRSGDSIAHIDVDGEHLYFACNNGCSPEGTLETFKTMLR